MHRKANVWKNISKLKKSCCKLLDSRIFDSGALRCFRKKSIWLSLMFRVGPVAYLRLSNVLRGQLLSQRLVVSVQVACFQVYVSGECELLLRPKMRVYTLRKQLSKDVFQHHNDWPRKYMIFQYYQLSWQYEEERMTKGSKLQLYGDQLTLSTQLLIVNYPVVFSHRRSTKVSLETYHLHSWK